MPSQDSQTAEQHMAVLSRLMVQGYQRNFAAPVEDLGALQSAADYVARLNEEQFTGFLRLADMHHVTVRALAVVEKAAGGDRELAARCRAVLVPELDRIAHAVGYLAPICDALDAAGSKTTVIKSLDHWPDLGSDLDLYTSGLPRTVTETMASKFQARQEGRSWGDRLANKWNFNVPGLPELVEIHVRYLGQTGEHRNMARRVIERSVSKTVGGHLFRVPAPEERILISTLQRMYRHFYFRLCDVADAAALLENREVNFVELRRAAETGGIWKGVCSFLLIVSEYVKAYGGAVDVPAEVLGGAHSPDLRVHFRSNFLRVPMGPAAGLYAAQLLNAGKHGDLRAIWRLPLLPPLAISALVAFRLTGSDKGVW